MGIGRVAAFFLGFLLVPILSTGALAGVVVLDKQAFPPERRYAGECGVEISGRIDAETVSRFKATFEDLSAQPGAAFEGAGEWGLNVCLASHEGDIAAAVDLANFLADRKIGTVVAPGSRCTGPCAVAFMGGTVDHNSEIGPLRRMSPGSVLGFSLDAEGSQENAYIGLADILTAGSLVRDRSGAVHSVSRRFPLEITLELLRNGGGQGFFVDNLHKVLILDIGLAGISGSALNSEGLTGLCRTAFLLNSDMPLSGPVGRSLEAAAAEMSHAEPVRGQNAVGAQTLNFTWGAMHPIDCSVTELGGGDYLVRTGDIRSADMHTRLMKSHHGLPLETRLSDIEARLPSIAR